MKAFEYASPASVADAVGFLGADGSAALSGGTDLINRMKDGLDSPGRVVNVKTVKDLAGITAASGGLVLGGNVLLAQIVSDDQVEKLYPALRQACLEIGTPQIKNMATLGGNLLQRPRCWYFRSGHGLLGGGEKQVVRNGDNRYHAIFMTDQNALFVAPSSLAPALIALGATATLSGPKGERTVPVEKLYQVPKKEGDSELAASPGELLTKVTIPAPKGKNATYEVRQKQAHDWPIVLVSVNLELDGDKVSKARVVLGGVAPVPLVSTAAADAITGKAVTAETADAAAAAALATAKPLSMNGYKVHLAKVAVKRALLAATGQRYWET